MTPKTSATATMAAARTPRVICTLFFIGSSFMGNPPGSPGGRNFYSAMISFHRSWISVLVSSGRLMKLSQMDRVASSG